MKKIVVLSFVILASLTVFAQSPEKLSYQAVVRDDVNQLVQSEIIGVSVQILQGSESGTVVYTETHTPTTNANGLMTIEIGVGTTTDDFSAIDWSVGPYFIKTDIDPEGGDTYTITGISQILSVPYALHAKTVDSFNETDPTWTGGGNEADAISRTGNVGIGIASPTQKLDVNGNVNATELFASKASMIYAVNPWLAVAAYDADIIVKVLSSGVYVEPTVVGSHDVIIPISLPANTFGSDRKLVGYTINYKCTDGATGYISDTFLKEIINGTVSTFSGSNDDHTSNTWDSYSASFAAHTIEGPVYIELGFDFTGTGDAYDVQIGDIYLEFE